MRPTLGRIVHYRLEDGRVKPAIIVGLHSGTAVDLEVFGLLPDVPERFRQAVEEETDTFKKNRWFWPPRVMG